jgi:Mrp family chromosome partitioning ATPase
MTALDQAFIRAYAQPGAVAAPSSPAAAAMRSSVLAALEQPLRTVGAAAPATGGFPVMHKQRPGIAIPEIVAVSPPEPQPRNVEQEVAEISAEPQPRDDEQKVADMPVKPEPTALRPAWQVDEFAWPRACRRLIARAAEELDRLADALVAISARGQKVLALGGWYRGEGATTLLLCAARRLVERGIKPVLVDADVRRPRLAKRLGLQPQCGWAEVTPEGTPLEQAIVESTANNIAVLPLREPPAEPDPPAADYTRLSGCIELLRDHYDMVLVDLGPLENIDVRDGLSPGGSLRGVDAVVLVRDHRTTSEERLGEIQRQLAEAGIALAGIIENFVAD